MFNNQRILAVVPARSGSKGIPDKNMQPVLGTSLIGWAGRTLAQVDAIDTRLLSTDSPRYAAEGERYGLEAPFLRPEQLSTDQATAIDTMQHALHEAEQHYGVRFDVILIVEPTCPLRRPEDIAQTIQCLVESGADSVVTVSPLPAKSHPRKILTVEDGRIHFFQAGGNTITSRQMLEGGLYWRNGVCYALTRSCLLEKGVIFTDNTLPIVITRPIVNIDEPLELRWAELLMGEHEAQSTDERG